MLQVLLVDDEPFILQGLRVLIDWEEEGYEIAAALENGEEALSFLKKNQVDLIIADIKMPGMSGLELLETIRREELSDAYFVILSGYNDFSYAQQAIRNNCTDYILKPVEKDGLLSILRKITHLSESSRIDKQNHQKMESAYLARNLIALLNGKYDEMNLEYVKNHMQLSEGIRYIDIEISEPYEDMEDGAARVLQRDLYSACQKLLQEDSSHAVFDVSHKDKSFDIGLIFCDYMAAKADMDEEAYLHRFHKELEKLLQHPVCMLVGKRVQNIAGISKSYGTSCILKSQIAFHAKKNIYFYEQEVKVKQGGIMLCKNSLDELIWAIEQDEKIQIRKSVDNLYKEIGDMGVAGDMLSLNINYLLFQLIHLAMEQDNEVNQEEILQFISESSFEDGIMRGSSVHLSRFACEYADYLAQLRKNVSRGVLQEIEKEVKEHYAENLSLRDLSRKYYINSSYLGQIFRKKYGQSFKDYLSHYRIDEAAKQLMRTDKKIGEIAEDVGYRDSDYFIRKFIEIKGCTPSKYRKNKLNIE
ncbi:MAG: response regulator [Roseburia sp.]|nr:response regulator [Ruminococcus sp.]MCM1155821.1 response regulator [Roseburia sp.]MCM1241971.1 response regulator [Roseburia sp.]